MYYLPSEIILRNPKLKQHWTPQMIGWLYKLKLVSGYKSRRQTLVNEQEVLQIFKIAEKRLSQ